jgi:hypothetical protein
MAEGIARKGMNFLHEDFGPDSSSLSSHSSTVFAITVTYKSTLLLSVNLEATPGIPSRKAHQKDPSSMKLSVCA